MDGIHYGNLIMIPRKTLNSEKNQDSYIPVLLIENNTTTKKILLYFHGNAEDIGSCQHFLKYGIFEWLVY